MGKKKEELETLVIDYRDVELEVVDKHIPETEEKSVFTGRKIEQFRRHTEDRIKNRSEFLKKLCITESIDGIGWFDIRGRRFRSSRKRKVDIVMSDWGLTEGNVLSQEVTKEVAMLNVSTNRKLYNLLMGKENCEVNLYLENPAYIYQIIATQFHSNGMPKTTGWYLFVIYKVDELEEQSLLAELQVKDSIIVAVTYDGGALREDCAIGM